MALPALGQGLPFMRNYTAEEYDAHTRNFDILVDPDEGVVYVANFEGLLFYDNAEWDIKHTPGYTRITKLYKDSEGTIWTGGYNYMGYLKMSDVNDLDLHALENVSDFRGEVNRIWEADGVVMFATVKNEVYRVDGERLSKVGEGEHLLPEERQHDYQSFQDGDVQRLQLVDNFWAVAEAGKGIRFTDGQGNEIFRVTEENGLINNNINRLSYDGRGLLWGATDNGFFSLMVPSAYS